MSQSFRIITVDAAEASARLDMVLAKHLRIPRSAAQQLIVSRGVRVDGILARKKGQLLANAQRIEVSEISEQSLQAIIPQPDFPLVELNYGPGWIAINKPPGIPVHPLHPGETGTLLNALVARYPQMQNVGEGGLRSGVVHRLDIDTSGVILFATEQSTWQHLRRAFQQHRVQKIYHAIVAGKLTGSRRLILDLVIAQHSPARVKVVDEKILPKPPGTRRCDLTYRALAFSSFPATPLKGRGEGVNQMQNDEYRMQNENPQFESPSSSGIPAEGWDKGNSSFCIHHSAFESSLLEIHLGTGFLHQIRAMLAHIGHPILGDRLYGPSNSDFTRQMLHAKSLRIGDIYAESPYPADFSHALISLGLNK